MIVKRFITTFVICTLILVAVLALIRADLHTRQLAGTYDRTIFSYERTSYNQGRLELLGVVYTVDLDVVEEVKEKAREIYSHNLNYLPDFIMNTGNIFKEVILNLKDTVINLVDNFL